MIGFEFEIIPVFISKSKISTLEVLLKFALTAQANFDPS
jgi:hypothetical protein